MSRNSSNYPLAMLFDVGCRPLRLEELVRLYAATDWRVVLFHPRMDELYGTFPPTSMFKALALPYLTSIDSESALARELQTREPLRALCGFAGPKTPTRPMFWHFRHTPQGLYPNLMLRVLVALVLSDQRPNVDLPFVVPIPPDPPNPPSPPRVFQMDLYYPEVQVWCDSPVVRGIDVDTAGKTVGQLYRQLRGIERSRSRDVQRGAPRLPAIIKTKVPAGESVRFAIDLPPWLRGGSHRPRQRKDNSSTLGSSRSTEYTACHIVVLRHHESRPQVLLGRRLSGYGKGLYALPGGKADPEESLKKCTERELEEETGLRVVHSRPVSLWRQRTPEYPPVVEVGVLVDAFQGEPTRVEETQSSQWEWFDLDHLPAALFPPSRRVLDAYRSAHFPHLQWTDLESIDGLGT